jgi:hypothetical protein
VGWKQEEALWLDLGNKDGLQASLGNQGLKRTFQCVSLWGQVPRAAPRLSLAAVSPLKMLPAPAGSEIRPYPRTSHLLFAP